MDTPTTPARPSNPFFSLSNHANSPTLSQPLDPQQNPQNPSQPAFYWPAVPPAVIPQPLSPFPQHLRQYPAQYPPSPSVHYPGPSAGAFYPHTYSHSQPLNNPPSHFNAVAASPVGTTSGNTRKRGRTAGKGNSNSKRRKPNENISPNSASAAPPTSTSCPAPGTSAIAAGVCGVGSIPITTSESPNPSVGSHPALNNSIFQSKTQHDGRGSNHVATDVWYHVRPVASKEKPVAPLPEDNNLRQKRPKITEGEYLACRLCTGEQWYAIRNAEGQSQAIRNHLRTNHWAMYRQSVLTLKLKGYEDITRDPESRGFASRQHEPFSIQVFREKLVRWITVDDQSFDVVDCPELRDLLLYIGVDLEDSDIPHRTRLTELIINEFKKEVEKASHELKRSLGRISFTSDMWSNSVLKGYMAITAHYMIRDELTGHLVMRSRLIAFRHVEGTHSGANMGKYFLAVLDEYGIAERIGMITLDNASNNDSMMRYLEEQLTLRDIPFHRDGNRVRCFPHVINISVKTGLSLLTSVGQLEEGVVDSDGVSADELQVFPGPNLSDHAYREALEHDPVALVRELVNFCRASGNRREELQKTIIEMRSEIQERIQQRAASNDKESSSDGDHDLLKRVVVLLRDVETRWSSVFLMVDRFLELYPAVKRFLSTTDCVSATELSDTELLVLDDIRTYLYAFHSTQEAASAEKTPTLSIVLPLYECLILILKNLKNALPNLSHVIDASLTKLYEYVDKARKSRIYALAMAVNPTSKLSWVNKHWSSADASAARNWIHEAMLDHGRQMLSEKIEFSTSRKLVPVSRAPSRASARVGASWLRMQGVLAQSASLASVSSSNSSSSSMSLSNESDEPADSEPHIMAEEIVDEELGRWLAEPVLSEDADLLQFDLVNYWDQRVVQKEYPVLFRVAMDVLPVQASAVPCERVFSSSKETDTPRRSRISPKMFEVLQILKFVYRAYRLDFSKHWLDDGSDKSESDRGTMLDINPDTWNNMVASGQISELVALLK